MTGGWNVASIDLGPGSQVSGNVTAAMLLEDRAHDRRDRHRIGGRHSSSGCQP
jgi:hypothetical protein